jgi:heat shock protein HslJ
VSRSDRRAGTLLVAAVGLVLAAIVAGCGSGGDDTANGGLAGTTWTVTSIAGTSTIEGSHPTMSFTGDGTVAGTDGCNRYTGRFHTDGDTIEVSQLATTLIGCEPRLNAQAQAFGAALTGATTWQLLEDGQLELSGQGDMLAAPPGAAPETVAPASGEPAAGLAGTSWVLIDLDGTGDFAHLQLTLEFSDDGSVSGFSGCNTYNGPYSVDGGSIDVGPLATTKMACERPGSAIESVYLPALDAVGTWDILETGDLVLSGPSTLTFTPA